MATTSNVTRFFLFILAVICRQNLCAKAFKGNESNLRVKHFESKAFIENKWQMKAELPEQFQNFKIS